MAVDPRLQSVKTRLSAHKGPETANRIVADALSRCGLSESASYTAQELLCIAEALISHTGFVELVGRNLKVQALQAGATLQPPAGHP